MNRWIVVCGLAVAVLTSAVGLKNAAVNAARATVAPQLAVVLPPPPPPVVGVVLPPPPPPVVAQ